MSRKRKSLLAARHKESHSLVARLATKGNPRPKIKESSIHAAEYEKEAAIRWGRRRLSVKSPRAHHPRANRVACGPRELAQFTAALQAFPIPAFQTQVEAVLAVTKPSRWRGLSGETAADMPVGDRKPSQSGGDPQDPPPTRKQDGRSRRAGAGRNTGLHAPILAQL